MRAAGGIDGVATCREGPQIPAVAEVEHLEAV